MCNSGWFFMFLLHTRLTYDSSDEITLKKEPHVKALQKSGRKTNRNMHPKKKKKKENDKRMKLILFKQPYKNHWINS